MKTFYAIFLNNGFAEVKTINCENEAKAIEYFEEIEHNTDQWMLITKLALMELTEHIEYTLNKKD